MEIYVRRAYRAYELADVRRRLSLFVFVVDRVRDLMTFVSFCEQLSVAVDGPTARGEQLV
jgi:hypothetical protein